MEGENKSMIPAYKAREISQKCGEYMNKLDSYRKELDSTIRSAASVGKTVIEFEIKERGEKESIANDLKRVLVEEKYSVNKIVTPEKHILKISWQDQMMKFCFYRIGEKHGKRIRKYIKTDGESAKYKYLKIQKSITQLVSKIGIFLSYI